MENNMKLMNTIAIIALAITATSCVGPLYTTEVQHTAGLGVGVFGSEAATRAKVNRMALAKMQATPVQIGVMGPNGAMPAASAVQGTNAVPAGYFGIIANFSRNRRLLFKYSGPESGSEYLGPGQQVSKYLLPGEYTGVIISGNGRVTGRTCFRSEPVDKGFIGQRVHWAFFAEW